MNDNQSKQNRNQTTRYMKYAIGEIILVVIGILIALQVSNWNTQRKFDNRMEMYYKNINEELKLVIEETKNTITIQKELKLKLETVLEILKVKDTTRINDLQNNLGAVATVWTASFSPDVFNEFIRQELLSKVKDKELKNLLTNLKHEFQRMKAMDVYNENQYNILLEPYIANTVNYSAIALPQYKKDLIKGGPETDFQKLLESVELWNRVTFKLETTNLMIRDLNLLNDAVEKTQTKLENLNY